jgi:hypothetical protein
LGLSKLEKMMFYPKELITPRKKTILFLEGILKKEKM